MYYLMQMHRLCFCASFVNFHILAVSYHHSTPLLLHFGKMDMEDSILVVLHVHFSKYLYSVFSKTMKSLGSETELTFLL